MTAVVVFNRDLRVHDHPALAAAASAGDRVVPLFVLDDAIVGSRYGTPNRLTFLLDCLRDLRGAMTDRGGSLVVRRGNLVDEVRAVCHEVDATSLHASADVGIYAQRRERHLAALADELGITLTLHASVTVVPPGELSTSGGEVYKVFTPYYRVWRDASFRPLADTPEHVVLPPGLATGSIPARGDLVDGEPSPDLPKGGEGVARGALDAWLDDGIDGYGDGHDDLAGDRTSRLSPYLHFGCLSPREIVARLDLRRRGHEPFHRQLCWRDFHHQTTWALPTLSTDEYRSQGDRWGADDDALAAWQEGKTGYPVVDAGMRQLRREGWLHNRARLIVASFLTKDLYVDWRLGAQHFLDWLVDGDIANNSANWQWVAGTGTDSRPNRVFNPVTQGKRFDPDGAYIRRYVPELAHLDAGSIHEPWTLEGSLWGGLDYPAPIVDHAEARIRFLEARGAR